MGVNMDAQGRIANAVLRAGRYDVGDLFYNLGMNGSTGGEIITSMVKRGLLKRSGDIVSVGDRALLQKCVDVTGGAEPIEEKAAPPATAVAKVNGAKHVPVVPAPPAKKDPAPPDDKPKAPAAATRRFQLPVPERIEIRKGVPLPAAITARKACPWPFDKMDVGDSFVVPVPTGVAASLALRRVSVDAIRYRKQHSGWTFRLRILDDGASIGVWRVKG